MINVVTGTILRFPHIAKESPHRCDKWLKGNICTLHVDVCLDQWGNLRISMRDPKWLDDLGVANGLETSIYHLGLLMVSVCYCIYMGVHS
jgi:hypothetical protein